MKSSSNPSASTISLALETNATMRWFAVFIWIIIALLHIPLFFIDIAVDYSQIVSPCEDGWSLASDCNFLAISSTEAELLSSWGMTMQQYAIFMLLAPTLTLIAYCTLGFLILWRQGASFLGLTVSLALVVFPVTTNASAADLIAIHPNLAWPGIAVSLLGISITFLFIYLLPNGRFYPGWAYIPLIGTLLLFFVLSLGFSAIIPISELGFSFLSATLIGLLLFGVGLQIYRYFRDSNAIERQQSKWILFAIVIFAVSVILWVLIFGRVLPIPAGTARLLANMIFAYLVEFLLLILPAAISLAILRYGLWNIDIVINRSLVGAIVTIVLLLIFVPSVFLIQSILGAENTVISFIVSAAILALIFNPTRKRVRQFIDRRVYGLAFNLDELGQAQKAHNVLNPGALTGQKLGDYEVRGLIGKGGMGEVYQGVGAGQTVAIKTMLPEVAKDMDMRSRFEREAQAGKTLQHPNIARVYGNGTIGDTPYIIMEYIEGHDLSAIIRSDGALDTETAVTIIQHICSALTVAHKQGSVHRDIKPSNIMIQEDNSKAVLMDFGIMKTVDASSALTGTGMIGTIDYMAPEQIMSAKTVDHRADIYALGIVLYEMLTGEKPFKGSAAQVMFAHIQQPPPYARDINSEVPEHIADAIEKAMEKDPEDRFDSAEAFAEALS